MKRTTRWMPTLTVVAALLGCTGATGIPEDAWIQTAAEESAPLGGEALAMMKREMERAHRDMGHFRTTLASLRERKDRSGSIQLSKFVDAYMGLHLGPLLRSEWQSRHPELMALDANLRLATAEVLIQLRDPRRAEQVLDEITTRFAGRGSLLVEYPVGNRSTLEEALQLLNESKWRG